MVCVEGDGTEPELLAGHIIAVDLSGTKGLREGIYVLRIGDACLVKRLQHLPGEAPRIAGANPAYEPFTAAAETLAVGNPVAIVGRVVWASRRV